MKKRLISLALALCMVIGMVTVSAVAEGGASSIARSYANSDNVFLGNDKMELGINQHGSFGTTVSAPTSGDVIFHPWSGAGSKIGLVSAPWSTYRDYFLPGTVDEGFLFYWNNAQQAYVKSSSIGNVSVNNYDTSGTQNQSSSDTLSATTTATVAGVLSYTQNISFKADEGFATVTITLRNTSDTTLSGVEYIRGFDPDQGSDYSTSNYYHTDTDSTVWIVATPTSKAGEYANVEAFATGIEAPFIFAAPASDDYTVVPQSQNVGWGSYGSFSDVTETSSGNYQLNKSYYDDEGIGLKFRCGNIAAGEEVTITYYMSLDTDVSNAIAAMKGAVSGGGVSTSTDSVTLELSAEATNIVVNVNDSPLTENVHYTIDKTNPLKPVITFLTAAGLTHESVITVDVILTGATSSLPINITNNIPAPTTYTVTYDPGANGSGTLTTATKNAGSPLTLAGAIFTRTGYTQTGWSTTDGGTQAYALNASYETDAEATLYPVWTKNTYTVTFDANGGKGEMAAQSFTYGETKTLTANTFTRSGYKFDGWNTAADGSGTAYEDGDSITVTGNLTLYAQWKKIRSSDVGLTITASSSIGGGITPIGETVVTRGCDKTYYISAPKGYTISRVLVDGVNVGAVTEYTFKNISSSHTIHVVFKASQLTVKDFLYGDYAALGALAGK